MRPYFNWNLYSNQGIYDDFQLEYFLPSQQFIFAICLLVFGPLTLIELYFFQRQVMGIGQCPTIM